MRRLVLIAFILVLLGACQSVVNIKDSMNFELDFSSLEDRGYDVTKVLMKMTHESGKTREIELDVEDGVATGRVDNLKIGT